MGIFSFESPVKFNFDPLGFAGGIMSMNNQNKMADKQNALQKEFAQNSIQWRVNDAKKAGIHPLAALGSQGISYNPSYVGGGENFGNSQMSIDIGGGESKEDAAFNDRLRNLQLEQAETELAKSKVELQKMSAPPTDPLSPLLPGPQSRGLGLNTNAVPGMPGQASSQTKIYGNKSKEAEEAARFQVNQNGTITIAPTQNIQDYISEDFLANLEWRGANKYTDLTDQITKRLKGQIPKGHRVKSRLTPLGYEYAILPHNEPFEVKELIKAGMKYLGF